MDNVLKIKRKVSEQSALKNWQLFVIIAGVYIVISLISDKFIMTRETMSALMSDTMEIDRIDDNFELLSKLRVYTYLALPFILWLKITIVALLLQTILVLKNIEATFSATFRISAIATISFVLAAAVKTSVLLVTPQSSYTFALISSIPGSITSILPSGNYSAAAMSFLNSINLFELSWITLMVLGLKKIFRMEIIDAVLVSFPLWLGLTVLQTGLIYYLNNI